MKLGIPRGLLFYYHYPFWETFFEYFDVQVIVTPQTTKRIMDQGVKLCVDDACLPVKIYHGHVQYLKDKCDKIFVPRIVSLCKDEFVCPKFCGLPEMLKHSIKGVPDIIDTTLDMNRNNRQIYRAVYELGKNFTDSSAEILKAYIKALNSLREYKRLMCEGYLPDQAIDIMKSKNNIAKREINGELIGLIGHPYNIYDSYISMDIVKKLDRMGYDVMTSEMVSEKTINREDKRLPKKMFWSIAKNIYGAAMDFARNPKIKGIVYLSAFGCGQDAFIWELVYRGITKVSDMPLTFITVDEHTGEAGFITRLEAFIDMIEWREKDENYISTHG
ncbi:MAG: acyl-CoA dehydratase activase-related protein [Clostridia bacterium]|nr:acyl-CoA dehydratase activase-related protein [Clostridia bacterium]